MLNVASRQPMVGDRRASSTEIIEEQTKALHVYANSLSAAAERLEAFADRLIGPSPKPVSDEDVPSGACAVDALRGAVSQIERVTARINGQVERL